MYTQLYLPQKIFIHTLHKLCASKLNIPGHRKSSVSNATTKQDILLFFFLHMMSGMLYVVGIDILKPHTCVLNFVENFNQLA